MGNHFVELGRVFRYEGWLVFTREYGDSPFHRSVRTVTQQRENGNCVVGALCYSFSQGCTCVNLLRFGVNIKEWNSWLIKTLSKGDTTHVYEVKCKNLCDHSGNVATLILLLSRLRTKLTTIMLCQCNFANMCLLVYIHAGNTTPSIYNFWGRLSMLCRRRARVWEDMMMHILGTKISNSTCYDFTKNQLKASLIFRW